MWSEEKSKTSPVKEKTFLICCQDGKVKLPLLRTTLEPLNQLLLNNTPRAVAFRQKIRVYNNIFSFTSFGAKIDDHINRSRGPYAFRISDQNYYRMGTLIPDEGVAPRFAQLYFHDTQNEVQNRMGCMNLDSNDIDPIVVKELVRMLDQHSVVSKTFRIARDWAVRNESTELTIKITGHRNTNNRQSNLPTVPEIAALITGDLGQSTTPRDVIINCKKTGLQRVSELHPLYMSLQCPLLFPHEEDGWYEKIPYIHNQRTRKTQRGHVTMREYYCYKLQQRQQETWTLIQDGRLYHQYIVDAFTVVEEQRLCWIKFSQNELRDDLYNNVYDAATRGDIDATSIGKRIILPSSFSGSPMYMIQN